MSARDLVMAAAGVPTGPAIGQVEYTTAGTHTWVVPAGVTSVSAVAIGPGGNCIGAKGAGGGALTYVNGYTVTPGSSYTIVVGSGGSGAPSTAFGMIAGGAPSDDSGLPGFASGAYTVGVTGSYGGSGDYGGGGGAAGYAGHEGVGDGDGASIEEQDGREGVGGGGGGGGGYSEFTGYAGKGGGTCLRGQGASGTGGLAGFDGGQGSAHAGSPATTSFYGGGGALYNAGGSGGAVRIIWPGNLRQFPSTRTADE